MAAPRQQATTLLAQLQRGEAAGGDQLFQLFYDDLKALARKMFRAQRAGHTLQPTALVHEAYVRLIRHSEISWQDRAHFFAIAAKAMRHVLIDHARAKATDKRGAGWEKISISSLAQSESICQTSLMALDAAMNELAELDPRKAQVVEMRFFAAMRVEEVAHVLGVSKTTVEEDWRYARAWLSKRLMEDEG